MSNDNFSKITNYCETKIKNLTEIIIDKNLNDLSNELDKYLNEITTSLIYNSFCKYYPSLAAKTELNIYLANIKYNYFYEPQFKDYAYVIKWTFTKQGCEDCSCLANYPLSKTCYSTDGPKRLQNNLVVCQPQCFVNKQQDQPNTLFGTWSGSKCIRRDTELIKFFTDASLRSDPSNRDKYTMQIKFPDNTREIEVHVDSVYCDQFGLVYDATKGSCETTNNIFSYAISFITGESLVKVYRLGENQMSKIADRMIQWASYSKPQDEYFTELKTREQAISEWWSEISPPAQTIEIPFRFSTHETRPGPVKINSSYNSDTSLIPRKTYEMNDKKVDNQQTEKSIRYTVDTIGQFIEENAPEFGIAYIIDKTLNKTRRKIIELEPLLKRLAPSVTQNIMESNINRIITTAAMRQMVKTSTMIAISSSLATRITVGTLRAGNILLAVGGIIDLVVHFLWDPIHLTLKPLDDNAVKQIIQNTTVQNIFPVELTPEIAWNEYYGKYMNTEEYSMAYLKAAFVYVQHRTFDHNTAIISHPIRKQIVNADHLPMAKFEIKEIKYTIFYSCVLSICLYTILHNDIVIFILVFYIILITTIQVKMSIKHYFSSDDYIKRNVAYII